MVSGTTSGINSGQFRELTGAVIRCLPDMDSKTAQGWIDDPEALRKALREALMPPANEWKPTVPTSLKVKVDYSRSVEEGVTAGHYDRANPDITSAHFPTGTQGEAEVVVDLVHFGRAISTDEALAELDKMGYRPINFHELLAVGEQHPDLQREFPIVELGSVWLSNGPRLVASLDRNASGRRLGLHWIGSDWPEYCRFGAVRK